MSGGSVRRRVAWAGPIIFAIVVVAVRVGPFLAPGELPARGDPSLAFRGSDLTPQFAPFVKIASDALWKQGTIAFWNPFVLCGVPLFETPQAGTVSLSTLLGGPLDWINALKMSMLIHLVAGMAGIFAFARRLEARPLFAGTAALVFALGGFLLSHFGIGHLNLIYPMMIMPWVLLGFARSLRERRVLSPAVFATGALVALQILEGGDAALLYQSLALALAVPIAFTFAGANAGRRALLALAITGASAFVLSAFQILPMMNYMRLTSRAGGIALDLAREEVHEAIHPFPGPVALGLIAIAVVGLWRARPSVRPDVFWLGAIFVGAIAIALWPAAFALLWRVVPGFRYQRIPERALILVGVVGPVLLARGLEVVATWLSGVNQRREALRWALRLIVVAVIGIEAWHRSPPMPPMASVSRELSANDAMKWIAANANGSRMHIAETTDRNWGTEHDTVPLGLEVIAGYTPSDHRDYIKGELDAADHRTFLETSYQNSAALWGMLNVRLLLSTIPRSVAAFHLAKIAAPCPVEICQPRKSSGPFIYENERCLPRAWTVAHAVALVGDPEQNFQTALDVMVQPWFDPSALVLLQLRPDMPLPPADLIFSTDSFSSASRWNKQALEKIRVLAVESKGAVAPASISVRQNVNRIHISGASPGWLVVSERISMFPGWSARVHGAAVGIERANGVLGAIHIVAPGDVDLRYRPPGFYAGLAILACGVALMIVGGCSGK